MYIHDAELAGTTRFYLIARFMLYPDSLYRRTTCMYFSLVCSTFRQQVNPLTGLAVWVSSDNSDDEDEKTAQDVARSGLAQWEVLHWRMITPRIVFGTSMHVQGN